MPKKHTSIVYFHGIGTPERHASASHFLDYFDKFGQSQSKADIGKPRDFSYDYEIDRDGNLVNFVSFKRITTVKGEPHVLKELRVYEAYWAPEANPRFGPAYALFWVVTRVAKPFRILASKWRSFPALRTYALHRLSAKGRADQLQRLERLYRDFENWEARSSFPAGTFDEFLDSIRASGPENETSALIDLARIWRSSFAKLAVFFSLTFTSIAAIAVCWILTSAIAVAEVVRYATAGTWASLMPISNASIVVVLTLVLAPAAVAVFRRHLQDVLGWTLESEKDSRFHDRTRVVKYAQGLVRHVVANPDCGDCVIVSHSLGTSIAMEAIFHEGMVEKATKKSGTDGRSILEKIQFIFTIGSPIDIIFYMFYADRAVSHRYSRLDGERRPSVALPPFRVNGRAGTTKIVNVWSRFDPIAGPLFSLRKSLGERSDAIDNVEVLTKGAPFSAHTSYYEDGKLMRLIYWVAMTGRLPREFDREVSGLPHRRVLVLSALLLSMVLTGLLSAQAFGVVPTWVFLGLVAVALLGSAWLAWWRVAVLARSYVRTWGQFLRR